MTRDAGPRCATCAYWKRRVADAGVCWAPMTWHGAMTHEADRCDEHRPKVIRVEARHDGLSDISQ